LQTLGKLIFSDTIQLCHVPSNINDRVKLANFQFQFKLKTRKKSGPAKSTYVCRRSGL